MAAPTSVIREPAAYQFDHLLQGKVTISPSGNLNRNFKKRASISENESLPEDDDEYKTPIEKRERLMSSYREEKGSGGGSIGGVEKLEGLSKEGCNVLKVIEDLVRSRLESGPRDIEEDHFKDSFGTKSLQNALEDTETRMFDLIKSTRSECYAAVGRLRSCMQLLPKEKMVGDSIVKEIVGNQNDELEEITEKAEGELVGFAELISEDTQRRAQLKDAVDLYDLFTGKELPFLKEAELLAKAMRSKKFKSLSDDVLDKFYKRRQRLKSIISETVVQYAVEKSPDSLLISTLAAARSISCEKETYNTLIEELPAFKHLSIIEVPEQLKDNSNDFDSSKVLDLLDVMRWECFDCFRSVSRRFSQLGSFKRPLLVSLSAELMRKRVLPAVLRIIQKVKRSDTTPSSSNGEDMRPPLPDIRITERRFFLITLAESVYFLDEMTKSLERLCLAEPYSLQERKADAPPQSPSSFLTNLFSSLREDRDSMDELKDVIVSFCNYEKRWLEESLGDCFQDVSAIEAHGYRLGPDVIEDGEASLRYRLHFVKALEQLPEDSSTAIIKCRESLRRCAMVLGGIVVQPKEPGAAKATEHAQGDFGLHTDPWTHSASFSGFSQRLSHSDAGFNVEEEMRKILNMLVMTFVGAVETLLQGAAQIEHYSQDVRKRQRSEEEEGKEADGKRGVDSDAILAAREKLFSSIANASSKVDSFLSTFDVEEAIVQDEKVAVIDERIRRSLSKPLRREFRRELRSSLDDLMEEDYNERDGTGCASSCLLYEREHITYLYW